MRRETFIALRARRLAHQIASLFLNPPMEAPEFRQRVVSVEDLARAPLPYFDDDAEEHYRAEAVEEQHYTVADYVGFALVFAVLAFVLGLFIYLKISGS